MHVSTLRKGLQLFPFSWHDRLQYRATDLAVSQKRRSMHLYTRILWHHNWYLFHHSTVHIYESSPSGTCSGTLSIATQEQAAGNYHLDPVSFAVLPNDISYCRSCNHFPCSINLVSLTIFEICNWKEFRPLSSYKYLNLICKGRNPTCCHWSYQ